MAWGNGDRTGRAARLPRDWVRLRVMVLERAGYRCEWTRADTGARCAEPATDVDHVARGDDHRLSNLQALCGWHHARKSAREGADASHSYGLRRPPRARPTEEHPAARRRPG